MTIKRFGLNRDKSPLYCKAVVYGNTVYLAGQVAVDPKPTAAEQARQVLAQIDHFLKESGTDKSKLLKATVIFADFRDYDDVNKVWDSWVDPENIPVRTAYEAKLLTSQHRVAIEVTAAL